MTRGAPVSHFEAIDILLAEDSDSDAELTLRTLRMGRIMNDVKRVRDGVEALNLVFREGAYADRPAGLPKLILLDLLSAEAEQRRLVHGNRHSSGTVLVSHS
jgi:CheY-like chemotaxis protein